MPDPIFADPRLAAIYDDLDPDRTDLDPYVAVAVQMQALSLLDVGCGTGTLACMLAAEGVEVVAVDPAAASLDVARKKPHAERVRWLLGDATTLPPGSIDLATMTGNAAQVFLADEVWLATLRGIAGALRPSGRLVFEVRDPAAQAWLTWNRRESYSITRVGGGEEVESWVDLLDVTASLVSFRWTYRFTNSGEVVTSDSTLRFREREEVEATLAEAGFAVLEVRDAPDRPGKEFVFLAERL